MLAPAVTTAALVLFPAMGFTTLAQPAPILLLVPIFLCSYLGGFGPGIVSTILAVMGSAYIIMPPLYSFFIFRPVDRVRLTTLIVNGILVSFVSEALHRARRRAEAANLQHFRDQEDIARLNSDLQKRVAELETIYNTVPIGLAIVDDPEGRSIRGNIAQEKMLGAPPGGELSKGAPQPPPYRVFQEGHELAVKELPMQRACRGEKVAGQVVEILREDGKTLIAYSSATPLVDEKGRPRGAVGAFMDITEWKRAETELRKHKEHLEELIGERTTELERKNSQLTIEITERKRTEAALRESEVKYRALFENSMDAIFLTRPHGEVRAANKAACGMFGMTEEELIAAGREGIIDRTDHRFADALAERALYGRVFYELTYIRKDGTRFPAETSSFLYNEGRDSIVILHDITSRKIAEDTLRNYARRLIEMEEDLRRKLSAELHDEIGRDLTALGINHAILGDSLSSEAKINLDARINDSGKLIEDISRNVRNIMNSLRPPMLDDYGLAAALRWYAELFAKRTGVNVSLRIDEHFKVLAAERELTLFRIAQEALTNVSKHSGARNVTIRLGDKEGIVRLSITDDGKGFVHKPASPLQAVPGRGLNIMHERAELFGGSFKLESNPGEGTTVSVEIREEF